ncbi:MAG: threonine--tRNA ligase, partial [Chlorobi bacterium]|nr:threonine--tRNA ligase [Chlorobiota bacterium]
YEAAKELEARLSNLGYRVSGDYRSEKINRKIAESEQMKVPFSLILGKKEIEEGTVSVREHTVGNIGSKPIDEILKRFANLNIPEYKEEK